jgi:hypothetical protein
MTNPSPPRSSPLNSLPCGCSKCGCACPAHSPTGAARPCDRHAIAAVTRFVAGEAAALVTLALFVCMVGIWARILGH